jgi:hypothetical protein
MPRPDCSKSLDPRLPHFVDSDFLRAAARSVKDRMRGDYELRRRLLMRK